MIMLILIQFDVCGYDLVRALQLEDGDSSEWVSDKDCVTDTEDTASEWSDPVYRGVTSRSFCKVPLLDILSFIFIPIQREISLERCEPVFFKAALSNLSYLRYCVFLI